uniref:Tetraspanin-33 n=1 Tax=Anser brachyrhynchus TaxID=132585 RepID=A0A8B9BNX7_9AVES
MLSSWGRGRPHVEVGVPMRRTLSPRGGGHPRGQEAVPMWRMLSPWREVPDPMWRSLIPMWKSLSPRGGGEVAVPWEDTIPGGLITSRPPLAVAIPAVPPSPSSRPQFSVCLTVIFLLQLAAGALGFVFSDGARGRVSEVINAAIVHYRDDPDLQNLIDFGQKEFRCCGGVSYRDWSRNVYFNCSAANPSRERCSVPFSCCL